MDQVFDVPRSFIRNRRMLGIVDCKPQKNKLWASDGVVFQSGLQRENESPFPDKLGIQIPISILVLHLTSLPQNYNPTSHTWWRWRRNGCFFSRENLLSPVIVGISRDVCCYGWPLISNVIKHASHDSSLIHQRRELLSIQSDDFSPSNE